MSCEKDWIDVLAALLTPTIAVVGVFIAGLQCWLAHKKRKDDLFDKRYAFYKRLERSWVSTWEDDRALPPDWEDLADYADEAAFLFGKEISDHIMSLEGKRNTGHPSFPDEDFVKPFHKYLELK